MRVSNSKNTTLIAPFSIDKVLAAIKGMNPASSPGPDGLQVKFFQTVWDVIKPEVMDLFDEFYVGSIDLSRLIFGNISLIPNAVGAFDIHQFRPIRVINVIFRILAKGTSVDVALMDLGRLAFLRPLGPPKLATWDEMLERIATHLPDIDTAADRTSWCLKPSDHFSARITLRTIQIHKEHPEVSGDGDEVKSEYDFL
ncbi:Signal recognition particle 54 kDa protein, chloroplastic [Hordeum vulgare]|nr:Signal recognition particle 54 kDa protein, chloroplastic [Hordeum vulgare]